LLREHSEHGGACVKSGLTQQITGVRTAPVPFFIGWITKQIAAKLNEFIDPNIESSMKFIEDQLATSPDGGKYLCGPKLTAADILMSFPLMACKESGMVSFSKFPKIATYVDMLQKEPGFLKANEKIKGLGENPSAELP